MAEEVGDLNHKGKKHYDEVHAAKEGQRVAEAKLANIERCIKRDQEDFQAKETILVAAKEEAVLAKLAAEVKTVDALKQVAELMARLSEVEKLAQTEEAWFTSWKRARHARYLLLRLVPRHKKWGRTMPLVG